jgi:ElaB/YqjD/DUF883 family membrane-anchored ribosome-binding protein
LIKREQSAGTLAELAISMPNNLIEMENQTKLNQSFILFYSYSHKDENLLNQLVSHLAVLKRSGMILDWYDRKIFPGAEWNKQINEFIDKADVILLLISADFLASEYCITEANRALKRHDNGAAVIPVLLRPALWQLLPIFSELQALPKDARPVTKWANPDDAFMDICEGVLGVFIALRASHQKAGTSETVRTKPRRLIEPKRGVLKKNRFFDAALPQQVTVGDQAVLLVLVRQRESEGLRAIVRLDTQYKIGEEDVKSSSKFLLEFPLNAQGKPQPLDLKVKIESPDFVPNFQTKDLRVPPTGDSDLRIFLLQAQKQGDLPVNIELYQGEILITNCLLRTQATSNALESVPVNLISVPIDSPDDGDKDGGSNGGGNGKYSTGWTSRLSNHPTSDAESRELAVNTTDEAAADETTEDAEQIRAQIEETRSQMSETIDAIQEKLSMSNIKEQVSDQINSAVGTAKDAVYDATNTLAKSEVVGTNRSNPLPFALIGLGVGMLVLNARSHSKSETSSPSYGYDYDADNYNEGDYNSASGHRTENRRSTRSTLRSATRAVTGAAGYAYEGVSNVAGSAYSGVSSVAGTAYEGIGSGIQTVGTRAHQLTGTAQDQYEYYIEENPLTVGAVALAVGLVIGFMITPTQYDSQLIGEYEENLRKDDSNVIGAILPKAKPTEFQVSEEVQEAKKDLVSKAT